MMSKPERRFEKRILKTVFSLAFSLISMCLFCILASPDAICADDDGEFLIFLPEDKPGGKQTASSSTGSASTKKPVQKSEVKTLDMLQGVFYDLKQTWNRQPSKDFSDVTSDGEYVEENLSPTLKVVQSFVNGTWQKSIDINGRVNYSALNAYYSPTNKIWISSFYIGDTSSKTAPQAFGCPDDVKPNCWICIYSGYVVAPFSGKFRFVGFGDDFLVVRINRDIVFDYGRNSATLGTNLSTEKRSSLTAAADREKSQSQSKNPIVRVMPTINKSDSVSSFYSKNKLVIRSPEYMNTNSTFGSGLANGSVISVRQGEVLPIEILVGDVGGNFNYVLFVERLDTNGKVLYPDKPLLLFRTSEELPPSFSTDSAVAYDQNSPVWKVVDSRGRAIPSYNPSASESGKKSEAGTAKTDSGASSTQDTQAQPSNAQPQGQPRLTKTISTRTEGNVTIQTVTEYQGDTTIETVTTTEVKGNTTHQSVVVTEKKNGKVVKKTSSRSRTTNQNSNKNSSAPGRKMPAAEKSSPVVPAATSAAEKNNTAKPASTVSVSAPAASASDKTKDKSSSSSTGDPSSAQKHNPFGYSQRPLEDEDK
ncbi:MAG: hypothetical protein IJT68_01675 [Lentisphaeria bacterium]|nr:hypothetical protein [Lentisphaeria bacterium]